MYFEGGAEEDSETAELVEVREEVRERLGMVVENG